MKKSFFLAMLFVISMISMNLNAVNIEVTASVGPRKSSPNLPAFYANTLSNLVGHYRPGDAPDNAPSEYAPLGSYLQGGMLISPSSSSNWIKQWRGVMNPPSVFAQESGSTIWFTVRVWSSTKFNPRNLRCIQDGSDANNLFDKTETFLSGNPGYGIDSRGVIWNSDGSKTIVTGGAWGDVLVNEFYFVGSAAKTLVANTQSQIDSATAVIQSWPNFSLMCTWEYVQDGTVLASATKRLQLGGSVAMPTIDVMPANGGVHLMVESPGSSVIVQTTTLISNSTQWTDWAVVTGMQSFHVTGAPQQYFRLRLP